MLSALITALIALFFARMSSKAHLNSTARDIVAILAFVFAVGAVAQLIIFIGTF